MRLAFIVLRQQETWLLGGERKGGGHLMPHTKTKQNKNVIVSTFLDIILWSWLMAVYMVAYTHLYLYGN